MSEIILREGEVVIGDAELAELRKQAGYLDLSNDAHVAVRRVLDANGVPAAPFIDDHVGNAIWQRNEARLRGDTYRRRALCLRKQAQLWRRTNSETMVSEQEWSELVERQLAASREHASISLARSASDGLAKEAAESALEATKRAIVRDLWPHLDFQYPQITFAIQRAGETIAAAQAEAAKLAGLLARAALFVKYARFDAGYQRDGRSYVESRENLFAEIDAALTARDPQTAPPPEPPQAGTGASGAGDGARRR